MGGDEEAMGLLSAQSSNHLCGHVVEIHCGGRPVEAVVASVCNKNAHNCGVDMIRKTWSAATGGRSPGLAKCRVTLKPTLPMVHNTPKCFWRPHISGGNPWFASVGIFNTGHKFVVSAELDGVRGRFNGVGKYFDFSGKRFGRNARLVGHFHDGSSISMPLSRCIHPGRTHIWTSGRLLRRLRR